MEKVNALMEAQFEAAKRVDAAKSELREAENRYRMLSKLLEREADAEQGRAERELEEAELATVLKNYRDGRV